MPDYAENTDVVGRLIGSVGRRAAPPADDYQRVLRASREAWQRAVRQRTRRRWAYALAASLLVVSFGVAVLRQLDANPVVPVGTLARVEGGVFAGSATGEDLHWLTTPGVQLNSGTRMRTDSTGSAALNLSAHTSLRLAPSSDLLLQPRQRIELIEGRVYFDGRAGGDGIEIVTRFGTLRDTGTQFEVLASATGLRVRTREGAVTVTRPDAGTVLTCAFSEELRIDASGRIERGRIAPHDVEWRWAEALAEPPSGAQLPLREFLDWVARESGRRLRYDSPETEARVSRVILHGTTPALAPVEALEVTLATTDFDFALLDDGSILLRPRQTN